MFLSLKRIKGGFTLIELLVVIAIIGVLASVVLASLNSARVKGRNASRLANIDQITLALELAFDSNQEYPNPVTTTTSWRCLGDYVDDACWSSGSYYPEDSGIVSALDPFLSGNAFEEDVAYSTYENLLYRCTDAACQGYELRWFMETDNESTVCGIGAVVNPGSYAGATYCQYIQ